MLLQRMNIRIARQDRSGERPLLRMDNQFCYARVVNDVETHFAKSLPLAFLLSQNVVVWLVLKAMRSEQFPNMLAQELHGVPLVGIKPQPHPDQMNVVGHQTVSGAEQSFP